MKSALDSAIGLARSETSASLSERLVIPEEVSSSRMEVSYRSERRASSLAASHREPM